MEVSEIIEKVDILDYIAQYIDFELGRDGEFWGSSCFSVDRTPSFSVNRENQCFYDFSTGRGGNIIDFIMEHDSCSLYEAIQKVKRYANIDDNTESEPRSLIYTIAKKYTPRAKRGKDLTERKFLPEDVMDKYQFNESKLRIWEEEDIPYEVMKHFNVKYDPYSNRIVFPIKDNDGNIISVCGRTCDERFKEKRIRKYTYFQPIATTNFLYNLSSCLQNVYDSNEIILFEGCKSVMKAYSWGYMNCCAVLTSHLNEEQMKTLIRLRANVVFALDEDVNILDDRCICRLKHYVNCSYVKNDGTLGSKMSPVDMGKDVWDRLYENRRTIK